MDFLMKHVIIISLLAIFTYADNYTFLVKPYQKEIELEAKIIAEIAASSLNEPLRLFIPEMSKLEKSVYAQYATLSATCEDANFIFINKNIDANSICHAKNTLYFTNNYRKLLSDERYFGAFFWNKSRPNIVFIQRRLQARHIHLPSSFEQFIESIE
jgi:hypothetical protein